MSPERASLQRPFTGMPLDRASTLRKDPQEIARLLEMAARRTLLAGRDGIVLHDGELWRTTLTPPDPILLGLDRGRALFAADLDALPEAERRRLLEDSQLISLRDAAANLPRPEAGLAAYLTALLGWHRRHRFCANCGAATEIVEAGYSRHCPRCGADHFPRTDPVVIMTVEHDRRILLGRRAGWPPGRLSVLAGFVSPGESAEEAVVREVQEESGIIAFDPRFVTSQPWPFPASLMLGFEAESDGGEPASRDGELEEVGWFGLDEVRRAIDEEHPALRLPPPISIARFLIERWVERHFRS
jgi:NAD+ diphosphatase